jgi:hypothetical protein
MMPAESGMIRRLRVWQDAEKEKQRELMYWQIRHAQACQPAPRSLLGMGAQQANAEYFASQANSLRPCTELELLKLGTHGSRTETQRSPLSSLGSMLG